MAGNLILTGFSGTGKSHVGRVIADLTNTEFIDIDSAIVVTTGKSVAEIFASKGEPHFRMLEAVAIEQACLHNDSVISTGGGTILSRPNYDIMASSGLIICLDARPPTIIERLKLLDKDINGIEERPLLTSPDPIGRVAELKMNRQQFYDLSNYVIDTDDLTVHEVARIAIELWGASVE